MGKWLYFNSPTIQAVCAILGLIGLAVYAWDTRKIRHATLTQSEASRRPFFTLESFADGSREVQLKNVGVGIALGFSWRFQDKDFKTKVPPSSVAPKGGIELRNPDLDFYINMEHVRMHGLYATYTDTAGKAYWSSFTLVGKKVRIDTGEIK